MSVKESLSELPDDMLKKGMLKRILEQEIDTSEEVYKKSFKEMYKVNLDIDGVKGYQIFEPTKYEYKYDEHLEDPNVTILFRDMDYLRGMLRGEKVGTEWGRDNEYYWHMYRKDIIVSTRMHTNERNAQILISKIPIFDQTVQAFGTSRLTRPLRDEPEPINPVEKDEIAALMKKMLSESADVTDEVYQKNFQAQVLKVNWDINGNLAYQIFEETNYNYEFGKHIEDADLTIEIKNQEYAKRFLLDLPTNYAPGLDDEENLILYIKIPVLSIKFDNPNESRYSLVKLPFFRDLLRNSAAEPPTEENKDERENYGHYISVNLPMGDIENEVVPYKVFEHFINKASNIVLRTCPCRERGECQNHSIEYGCIFMGDDTKNMALSPDEGYVATKEQALEHLRNAMADGLVPLMGRNVGEAEDGHGVRDTGKFLSGCFCCECCCIGVKLSQYGVTSGMGGDTGGGVEGMKIKVDLEKCDGCGTCIETCPYNFRRVVDGKSTVDPNQCIGCGRCVAVCPNGAISLDVEDPDYIEKFIAKIESIVDVEDQTIKA
jgi:UDP-glucose 4-epimerase